MDIMIEGEVPSTSPVAGPSEEELMTQLQAAITGGDFKAVAKVSAQLVKFQNERERAESTAKLNVVKELAKKVQFTISKALAKMYESGELDNVDGVWFTWDFGEKESLCRLLKSAVRAEHKAGGGGTGKKYPSTAPGSELWEKHKNDLYKESGMTVEAAHNSNTDKNWRYAIHNFILKAEGLI